MPPRRTRYPLTRSELPVFRIAAFTSATVQEGCASRTSAAMPATCGVAMDVPENRAP